VVFAWHADDAEKNHEAAREAKKRNSSLAHENMQLQVMTA